MRIDNLAQFKRSMKIGSQWSFFDSRTGQYTIRTCVKSQTNSFALNNHPNRTDKNEASWLDYPKAKELIFIQEEGQSTKIRINLWEGHYLIYQPIEETEGGE